MAGHQHMVDMKQQVIDPLIFSGSQQGGGHGVEVSKPMAKKTTVLSGFFGDAQGIEGS